MTQSPRPPPDVPAASAGVSLGVAARLALLALLSALSLLPDPGFEWLHDIIMLHKNEPDFWESNGEDTVELLKRRIPML